MTGTMTDLEIIEDLDFKLEPPCEHSQHETDPDHEGPAYYLLRCASPCGHRNILFYICKQGYERSKFIRCQECLTVFHREDVWTIVGTLS